MQKQRKPQQRVKLVATVQASSGVFPGLELADLLEGYARFVRQSTYTGELDVQGTFLNMKGGVVWEHEDTTDVSTRRESKGSEEG